MIHPGRGGLLLLPEEKNLQAQKLVGEAAMAILITVFGFLIVPGQALTRPTRKPALLHLLHQNNAVKGNCLCAVNHIGTSRIMAYISSARHRQEIR